LASKNLTMKRLGKLQFL